MFKACKSLIVHEGAVGTVGTSEEAAVGYYLVKWLSEPHTLQNDTSGLSGMIPAGIMVVDALYFTQVHRAQHWYTPSAKMTVVEVMHILRTGLQVQPLSVTNALPLTCVRVEATWKKAMTVLSLDHKAIMEEASKCDRLKYEDDDNR